VSTLLDPSNTVANIYPSIDLELQPPRMLPTGHATEE
jgi:hypothetical protein